MATEPDGEYFPSGAVYQEILALGEVPGQAGQDGNDAGQDGVEAGDDGVDVGRTKTGKVTSGEVP